MADREPDGFELEASEPESELKRIRRITSENYQHKIAIYCQRFGRRLEDGSVKPLDRKTVERWIRRGREVEGGQDLPPLDSPGAMAEWYRRVIGRKVPVVLLSFEEKEEEGGASEPGVDTEAAEVAAKEALREALAMADNEELGFEASLHRARQAERLAYVQWQVCLLNPDDFLESAISKRKKAWEDASGVLLRLETAAEKIMDQSDEWARWSEVEAELGPKLSVIARGVRSLLVRVTTKETLPPGLFEKINPVFEREVDSLFGVLGAGGFAPLLELSGK